MEKVITTQDLELLVETRDFARLREEMMNWPADNIAELMEPLTAEKEAIILRFLPRNQAADVFSYLPREQQEQLLKAMATEEVAAILNALSDDDRTSLLEELPGKITQQLLNLLSPEERNLASRFLGYPENSVGRLMSPHFVRVRAQWTLAQALDHIRRYGLDSETMSMVYVIDDQDKLIDDLRIRQILLAPPDKLVADIMDSRFDSLKATDDREIAVQVFRETDLFALPVTDSEGELIGIVTVDDILRSGGRGSHGRYPKDRRFGGVGRALYADRTAAHGAEASRMAGDPVPERDADGDRDGEVRKRDRQGGDPFDLRAAGDLQRGQLRLAGLDDHHPRDGAGRGAVERLVARDEARVFLRAFIGGHPGQHRLHPHFGLGECIPCLWAALVPAGFDSRIFADRDRAVGNAGRLYAAAAAAQAGSGPGDLLSALRGDAGGRLGADHLL